MGGLLFAAIFPFAPLGALAAGAYALAHSPLAGLTGIGRWDVHLAFSALGAALSLWVALGPALALTLAAARLAGLRSGLLGGVAAGLVTLLGLATLAAATANGGFAMPGIATELVGWSMILVVPTVLGATWTAACVAIARRWRLRIARRGVASDRRGP